MVFRYIYRSGKKVNILVKKTILWIFYACHSVRSTNSVALARRLIVYTRLSKTYYIKPQNVTFFVYDGAFDGRGLPGFSKVSHGRAIDANLNHSGRWRSVVSTLRRLRRVRGYRSSLVLRHDFEWPLKVLNPKSRDVDRLYYLRTSRRRRRRRESESDTRVRTRKNDCESINK